MYVVLAHSLCAKTSEVINKQIPNNTVLIVPGFRGKHRLGTGEVYSRIGIEEKGFSRNFSGIGTKDG